MSFKNHLELCLLTIFNFFILSFGQTCTLPPASAETVDGWIFVIDISGSMANEIAAVRSASIDLANELNDAGKQADYFILTEFHNDPLVESGFRGAETHFRVNTPTDVCDFIDKMGNIVTEAGNLCAEAPFRGILESINEVADLPNSVERGNVFVFTDADRNTQDTTRNEILQALPRDGVSYRINFILSSSCDGGQTIDNEFSLLASETNGIIIPTTNADIEDAVGVFKDFLIFQNQVPLAQVETNQNELINQCVEISGGVNIIIILISGEFRSNPQITRIDFDGEDFPYNVTSGSGYLKITVDTGGNAEDEAEWCMDINFDAPPGTGLTGSSGGNRRRLLQNIAPNRINVYAGDPTVIVDITVSNINDQNNPVSGSGGNLFYDADGSFVVIGESANDEVLTFTQFKLKSLDDTNQVSNSGADVVFDAVNDVYFTIFDFSDLDTVADVNNGERFIVEAKGLDSQGNSFTRLANLAVSLVSVSVVVDCTVTEFEIFTQTDDACTITVQRSDDTLSQSYTLSGVIDNNALDNDVSLLFGTTTISLASGESSDTTTLDVIISDNELIVGESFSATVFVDEVGGDANNFFVVGPFSIPDGTKEPSEEPTPQPTEEPTEERSRL